MVLSQPVSNVAYRIANVDFNTFLELSVLDNGQGIKSRPLKKSMKQQWYFSPVTGSPNTYKIRNASSSSPSFWLGIVKDEDTEDLTPITVVESSASQWILSAGDSSFEIYLGGATTDSKYLQLKDSELYLSTQNFYYNQKWQIIFPPSIKAGSYRIRSLSGDALLTSQGSGSKILASAQNINSLSQKWTVILDDNGKCAIRTQAAGTTGYYYLSYDLSNSIIQGSENAFYWDVRVVDSVTYTINLDDSSVGFADYEVVMGESVNLVKNNGAYSQLWFFEPWVTAN